MIMSDWLSDAADRFERRTVSHVEEPDHPVYVRDDLHARIAVAVAEKRVTWGHQPGTTGEFIIAACDHADDVLARHRPFEGVLRDDCEGCTGSCEDSVHHPYPCPEVRALADLWLGKGWDQ